MWGGDNFHSADMSQRASHKPIFLQRIMQVSWSPCCWEDFSLKKEIAGQCCLRSRRYKPPEKKHSLSRNLAKYIKDK